MGQAFDEVDAALACLGADQLRVVVRDLLREVDERAHGRVVDSLIAREARTGSGWVPAPLARDEVAEALSFAAAARRVGHADPCDVDEHLRRGSGAFLRRDYAAAHRILGALLPLVAEGEIDLGQHELAGEVLGVDLGECAARYVVSVYLVSASPERAGAELAAIGEARGVGSSIQRTQLDRTVPEAGSSFFSVPLWYRLIQPEVKGGASSRASAVAWCCFL